MKAQEHRRAERQQSRFEADLEGAVGTLFRRWPVLCGFAVRERLLPAPDRHAAARASELFVTEISVYPQRDLNPPQALCSDIVSALATLLDECPEVCELLRGRTFARVFH
jgi:hypothetical protein